ncbi:MAG: multiheme c-type cytochrome [Candidatus Thiodiazotropha sp.]|jgi:predicted CXXCH cytochrome family protein
MKIFSIIICLVVLSGSAFSAEKTPEYTGSLSCESCHQVQFAAWSDSHHSWAWRKSEPTNVLGNFNNVEYQHAGFTYKFIRKKNDFYIIADNEEGNAEKFRIHSVVGVTPLQQYLVETGSGHLQALDVAWDTERKHWYHLYPDEDTTAGNGMHWTGFYKNWNSRCAECHATDFRKNYDPLNKSYTSRQAEIGVGCEACHGPGEAHLSWANAPDKFSMGSWNETDAQGLTAVYQSNNAASEINLCAGCHSRREPIGANSPEPGSHYTDNYRLALLRDGLYYPDGQIHDEVYVYGSFLQSKMHEKGVKCSHCHDTHSYQLKAEGNALCTQCHNAQGNALFPSLNNKDYDAVEHHFHQADSEGAECKQCHMPERYYMVVDGRRDHSFRIPRPDLSAKMDVPNVCNTCHQDKLPGWAVEEIAKRKPGGQLRKSHFAEVFNSADSRMNNQTVRQLLDLANDQKLPAIVRASALERLFPVAENLDFNVIDALLADDNAWVRVAAANLLVHSPYKNKIKKLLPLLSDSVRSVRLEAVKAFLETNLEGLTFSDNVAVKKAIKEYQQSLANKADFPEVQMVIGGVALIKRNISAAISAFSQAVEMDPQLIQAWVMLARIQAAVGQPNELRKTLDKAIKANPNNLELQQFSKNLEF